SGKNSGNDSGKNGKHCNVSHMPSTPNFSTPARRRPLTGKNSGNKTGKCPSAYRRPLRTSEKREKAQKSTTF
ncbi:MAG TPA: hypothetical protein VF678_13700, partial [bacterium]